jgi:hypothetical protein
MSNLAPDSLIQFRNEYDESVKRNLDSRKTILRIKKQAAFVD